MRNHIYFCERFLCLNDNSIFPLLCVIHESLHFALLIVLDAYDIKLKHEYVCICMSVRVQVGSVMCALMLVCVFNSFGLMTISRLSILLATKILHWKRICKCHFVICFSLLLVNYLRKWLSDFSQRNFGGLTDLLLIILCFIFAKIQLTKARYLSEEHWAIGKILIRACVMLTGALSRHFVMNIFCIFVFKVCCVGSRARCGDTAYKARLFSCHHNGQGLFCLCSLWNMLKLLIILRLPNWRERFVKLGCCWDCFVTSLCFAPNVLNHICSFT